MRVLVILSVKSMAVIKRVLCCEWLEYLYGVEDGVESGLGEFRKESCLREYGEGISEGKGGYRPAKLETVVGIESMSRVTCVGFVGFHSSMFM